MYSAYFEGVESVFDAVVVKGGDIFFEGVDSLDSFRHRANDSFIARRKDSREESFQGRVPKRLRGVIGYKMVSLFKKARAYSFSGERRKVLAAEIVKEDIFGFDSEIIKHFEDGLVHHGRTTNVVFAVFGSGMVFEVFFEEDIMDEACIPGPFVFWQGV